MGRERRKERERDEELIHKYLIKEKTYAHAHIQTHTFVLFKVNYICAIKIFVSFKGILCMYCSRLPLRFVAIHSVKINIFGFNCNVLPRILCWVFSHLLLSHSINKLSIAQEYHCDPSDNVCGRLQC